MKKYQCLLLDANVVIELFSLGLWDAIVKQCEIHLSEIVIQEASYYPDASGNLCPINLDSYLNQGSVHRFSRSTTDLLNFKNRFGPNYFEKLDPGETESLLHLVSGSCEDYHICSSDAIVFRVLAHLSRSHQGVSLEELLDQFSIRQNLQKKYTRAFRLEWCQRGLAGL